MSDEYKKAPQATSEKIIPPPESSQTKMSDVDLSGSRPTSIKRFRVSIKEEPNIREMKNNTPSVSFIHNEGVHKCCCGSVHVKQGALVIGYVSIIMCAIHLISLAVSPPGQLSLFASVGSSLLQIACSILMIVGIKKHTPWMLIPFAVLMAISIVCCLLGMVFFAVGAFWARSPGAHYIRDIIEAEQEEAQRKPNNEFGNMLIVMVSAFMCIILFIAACLSIWWFRVTLACRSYLAEMHKSSEVSVKFNNNPPSISPA